MSEEYFVVFVGNGNQQGRPPGMRVVVPYDSKEVFDKVRAACVNSVLAEGLTFEEATQRASEVSGRTLAFGLLWELMNNRPDSPQKLILTRYVWMARHLGKWIEFKATLSWLGDEIQHVTDFLFT